MPESYGDFELLKKIATGGMAEIYLGVPKSRRGVIKPVVVKRMLPQLAVRPDFVQMFLDEARLTAHLQHPNIVAVTNLGQVGDSYFIAMELVNGPHLGSLFAHSLRARQPLPIELCCYIVARAADGLHYAHDKDDPASGKPLYLVHRDISPQNILISHDGDVKVTDFGVAKASTHQTKTRTGIIKGKVAYMSPEQCLGDNVDRRTDVFALGIVLYELLTRRRLFRDKSDLLIMQRITGEDVAPASSVNTTLPPALDEICARALARDREQRYATAEDLGHALDEWLLSAGHSDELSMRLSAWFARHAPDMAVWAPDAPTLRPSNKIAPPPAPPPSGASLQTSRVAEPEDTDGPIPLPAREPRRPTPMPAPVPAPAPAPVDRLRTRTAPLQTPTAERDSTARVSIDLVSDNATLVASRPVTVRTHDRHEREGSSGARGFASDLDAVAVMKSDAPPDAVLAFNRIAEDDDAGDATVGLSLPAQDDADTLAPPPAATHEAAEVAEAGGHNESLNSFVSPKSSVSAPPEPQTTHKRRAALWAFAVTAVALVSVTAVMWWRRPHDEAVPIAASPTTGQLQLSTLPAGAAVTVDGKPSGPSPLDAALSPGEHEAVVTFATGPVTTTFNVRAGENSRVVVHQRRALRVNGPSGARVTLAGAPIGVVPLELADVLTVGQVAELRVEADGFEAFVTSLLVDPATHNDPVAVFATPKKLPTDARKSDRNAKREHERVSSTEHEPEPKRERREKPERATEVPAFGRLHLRPVGAVMTGGRLDGERLPAMPFRDFKAKAGKHTLVLQNASEKINEAIPVVIPPDGELTVIVEFEKKGDRYAVKKITKR